MTDSRQRPLAPAIHHSTAGATPLLPRRHNVSRACVRCQQKKTKCFGGIPCQRCLEIKSPCVVDEDSDERRKVMIKRRINSLEKDRELLIQLVEALRDEDRLDISDTMNLIRSDASINELRSFVTDQVQIDSPAESAVPVEKPGADVPVAGPPASSSRRSLLNIQRLIDDPPYRVPARPWTSVTYDDDFVSHLISLYFTWEHQELGYIDRDLFLEAMQSRDLESDFCSPFLVNAVLSVACWLSDWPESMATHNDPSSKGLHFYHEARDLLDQQEGRVSLTSAQGLGALYASSCMMGKDRLGWKYLVEIGDSIRQIIAKRPHLIAKTPRRQEMERALDTAILGLFILTSTATMMLHQPIVMKKPPLNPSSAGHSHSDTWTPYPLPLDPLPAHSSCLTQALFDLQSIISDISTYFFGEHRPSSYCDAEINVDSFYQDLKKWSLHVPDCISLGHLSTPSVMDMHMRYHAATATIFGFIKPQPEPGSPVILIENARYLRNSSAQRICDILVSYRSRWSTNHMLMSHAQYATVALFILLEDLGNDKSAQAFVNLCIILCAMSRRWLLAKGMLRLVQLTARLEGIVLPAQTRSLFVEFASPPWKPHGRKRLSSLYPNFAVTVQGEKSLGEPELDLFLAQWDRDPSSDEDEDTNEVMK